MLIGLNFINPLHAEYQTGPAYFFADKLELVPEREFYDVLKLKDSLWFAGEGLSVLENGVWHDVYTEGRYTSLASDPEGKHVWFAGPDGVGWLKANNRAPGGTVSIEAGYIWDIVFRKGKLWFVGSSGYGWIDPVNFSINLSVEKSFEPRPFTMDPGGPLDGLLIGLFSGLWKIDENGHEQVVPIEMTGGNVVTWMAWSNDQYILGTSTSIYTWSGVEGEYPELVNSNYPDYFKKGISNAIDWGPYILITDYPSGVAFLDKRQLSITGYASVYSGLDIGDVYKIEKGSGTDIVVLGTEGVARVDPNADSLFFPSNVIFEENLVRTFLADSSDGFVFSEKSWVKFDANGFLRGSISGISKWSSVTPGGSVAFGNVVNYNTLEQGDLSLGVLPEPVHDLKWGSSVALASGQNGLYTVTEDLEMELVYPTDQEMNILGELHGRFFALSERGLLVSLSHNGEIWMVETLSESLKGSFQYSAISDNQIVFSQDSGLYRISNTGEITRIPIAQDWQVRGVASSGESNYISYYNPITAEHGVAVYGGGSTHMLSIPYLELCGEPIGLMANAARLGVLGSNGVGWYALDELEPVSIPAVRFDLFLDNQPVADRTIRSGMHYIDLKIDLGRPEIPSQVQYRINEGRWRNVNLKDPSLQFAGHGEFAVELRAVHPNGMSSVPRRVQFGIAPPWYLNPIFQGILFLLLLILSWAIYMFRNAQLKKRNIWLENEVRKATRELEAANAARINFLAGLSHDIRNPLNGVLMIAETLTRDPPRSGDDSRLKDLTEFGIIVDRMLGEILDFSAIDQANLPMALIPVSITDILGTSVKQNQFNIQKALVNITLAIDPELKEVVIKTDRNWMIKILTNLIVNALEYSESERIEVGAKCHKLSPEHVELEIFVKDWGLGIDDAEKGFVFERFYRGESGIDSGKHGTGLGLSICQDVAHAMGAHLGLSDNEPSGCNFFLKGRFARVAGAKELDQDAVLSQLRGKKVLIVDDLSYNRRSIVDFFKTIGCDCDDCENGREALQMLEDNSYDLALLDWDLPGLMGPEIAAMHRHKHPEDKVIIIALTAYTDGEKLRESEQAGMNGYISKPLTASRLAYAMANVEDKQLQRPSTMDMVDSEELNEEIYKHIRDCLRFGHQSEWENLRRCAHRLTTLALMRNNPAMQQVCRDLQVSAQSGNVEEIHIGLAELQQWDRR
ncbi:response regulator [Puniceicoccales bacterium CK1056]|uniref:histidine kinase n=1 Tax=Oceanipulchritudo coccoides TaxID=2706888 RepID=A0A6B2M2L7_9BACT|nr:response regulator [Oceanipulchritudo coccoides]NDV63261.1 response regulator [Oceanipulchritudo coccoides]